MALTRRSFCRAAAPALAAVVVPRAFGQSRTGEPRAYYGGFRVGIQSQCYGKYSLQEAIEKTTALGLKFVELSPAHADLAQLSTAEVRLMRTRFLDAGLSVHTYGVVDLRQGPQRRQLEAIFRRAEEFGIKTLLLDSDTEQLKRIERFAGRYRVNVAIVNRPGGLATADTIWQAVRDRSARLGAAVDTGAFLSAGQDPAAAITTLKGRLFAVQLTDVSASGTFCPLGQGKVDFPAVLKALREQKYDNVVTVACGGTSPDPDAVVPACLDYLKKLTGGK